MRSSRPLALVLLSLLSVASRAEDAVDLKAVPLSEFMQNQLAEPITLAIPVPREYEAANIPEAPLGYSYWMRPKDVAGAVRTGNMPTRQGYMYGKLSLDVGYDKESDTFMGLEEPESLATLKSTFPDATIQRCKFASHPVILLSFTAPDTRNVVYAMYLAMGIETNVVYLAIRPPKNSRKIGTQIMDVLKQSLSGCTQTASGP